MAVTTINSTDPVLTLVTKTNTISSNLGDVDALTNGEANLVLAINNLDSDISAAVGTGGGSGVSIATLDSDLGTVQQLVTSTKTSVVGAINYLDSDKIGALTSLNTTAKSSLVAAINEVNTSQSAFNEASEIRAIFSSGAGLSYDSASGQFIASSITSAQFSSPVTLLIKNSAGTTLKTIKSPGS